MRPPPWTPKTDAPGRSVIEMFAYMRWLESGEPGLLCFARDPGFVLAANFGPAPAPLPAHREILLASEPVTAGLLPPDTAAWLSA